ncbi:MAG: cyclopropane-fatty-acyl-phospholipid synthase family protein [Anaerolineales bacterium]|jgi:cyclopropane-fatty-acyl-phospholipid synthase
MDTQTSTKTDEHLHLTIQILKQLFDEESVKRVNVRLWDGTYWPDEAPRLATLVLKHPGALREMFQPGTEVGLGEAYLYDDFDVQGDLEQIFDIAYRLSEASAGVEAKVRLGWELMRLPSRSRAQRVQSKRSSARLTGRPHSIERDRQAVTYHYDVSNDFYAMWLDRRLVYSCAYFRSPDDDLDIAQEQKLDYICRKLRLHPGQRVLDIGCGWGGLVMYAAEHYGVDATGITLSQPQAELANARIQSAGLAEKCRVLIQDYRQIDELQAYDVLVSVGMFEHVGAALLPAYFEQAYRLLRKGGVFLNHGIACSIADEGRPNGSSFSQAYVFPDGELVPVSVTVRAAEEGGFEVRDVESLREHYVLTLRHWVKALEAHHTQSLEVVDEPIYRTWRLYMSGSAYGFSVGNLNLYQTLLVKPQDDGRSGLPLRREDWYRPPAK